MEPGSPPAFLTPCFYGALLFLEWREARWGKFVRGGEHGRSQGAQAAIAGVGPGAFTRTAGMWRKRQIAKDRKAGPKQLRSCSTPRRQSFC